MKVDTTSGFINPPEAEIKALLERVHTIAVVGLSPKTDRPSHRVAAALQSYGYRIIPVRPGVSAVLGETAYGDLYQVPHKIDMVEVFRAPQEVEPIVDACIALAINVWTTRFIPVEIGGPKPPEAPVKLTPAQEMAELLASGNAIIKANWSAGNVKALNNISGDVVWSDEKQKGYMRFRGLPVNDKNKETYQLWIFDKTQDKATPIDGGTFDVDQNGEVVIPINAKLKTREPGMFAVTVEKPGGVVVSKREKVAALATVVIKAGSNT